MVTLQDNLPALLVAAPRVELLIVGVSLLGDELSNLSPDELSSGCDAHLIQLTDSISDAVASLEASQAAALPVLAATQ